MHLVSSGEKRAVLSHLLRNGANAQTLVFTRTKHGANRLAEQLERDGIQCAAIHGNKSQNARTKALEDFKGYKVQVLVATDIAARGLDITELPQVVNYELPHVPEDYVHRIGRTGRAGSDGPGAVAGLGRRAGSPAGHRARARPQDQRAASRPHGHQHVRAGTGCRAARGPPPVGAAQRPTQRQWAARWTKPRRPAVAGGSLAARRGPRAQAAWRRRCRHGIPARGQQCAGSSQRFPPGLSRVRPRVRTSRRPSRARAASMAACSRLTGARSPAAPKATKSGRKCSSVGCARSACGARAR